MTIEPLQVTPLHLVETLGQGLYESQGQCMAELLRNAMGASMLTPYTWEPKQAKIEISLQPSHPLTKNRETVLVHLDHGSGMDDAGTKRFCNFLGTTTEDLDRKRKGGYKGDSQKGIGRFAAASLNERCLVEDPFERIWHGFYVFTRTKKEGDVRFLRIIPKLLETQGGFEKDDFISPTDTRLGHLRGIRGSFTAIIIPTPVFKTHDQIYESIKWFLPREQDKMPELYIGGKLVMPPPLESDATLTWKNGLYRARLGKGTEESDGIWLCDAETGFRVASVLDIGRKISRFPEALQMRRPTGDIFVPGLLLHQDSSRSRLAKDFVSNDNPEWRTLMMFLVTEVTSAAKDLLGEDPTRSDVAKAVTNIVSMFNERYGSPPAILTPDDEPQPRPEEGERKPQKPPQPRPKKPKGPPRRKRVFSIKVREEVYTLLLGQTLTEFEFAQIDSERQFAILLNTGGRYKPMPAGRSAQDEHCLMQILLAIGKAKFRSQMSQAVNFANEVLSEMRKK